MKAGKKLQSGRVDTKRLASRWAAATRNGAERVWQRLAKARAANLPKKAERMFSYAGDGTNYECEVYRTLPDSWYFRILLEQKSCTWKLTLPEAMLLVTHWQMSSELSMIVGLWKPRGIVCKILDEQIARKRA